MEIKDIVDLFREPDSRDYLWRTVNAITPVHGDPSALMEGMQYVLAIFVIIGISVLTYQVVEGVISTAYHGKVLGDKFHQIWGPLSVVLGFGLLIPVATFHANTAQLTYTRVILPLSINMFNNVAKYTIEPVIAKGIPFTPTTNSGRQVVDDIVEMEICSVVRDTFNKTIASPNTKDPSGTRPKPEGQYTETERGWIWKSKEITHTWSYGPACGAFTFSVPEGYPEFAHRRAVATGRVISNIRAQLIDPIESWIAGNTTTLSAKDSDAITLIAQSVRLPPDLGLILAEQANQWNEEVTQAAADEASKSTAETRQKIVDGIHTYGGTFAGTILTTTSQASGRTTTLSGEMPSRIGGIVFGDLDSGKKLLTDGDVAASTVAPYRDQVLAMESAIKSLMGLKTIELTANDLAQIGDEMNTGYFSKIFMAPLRAFFSSIRFFDPADPNPVQTYVSTGTALFWLGVGIWGASAAVGATIVGTVPGMSGQLVAMPLIVAGIFVSYVVPYYPAITMYTSLFIWAMTVIEGFLFVPLAALWMIRMDTTSLFDKGQAPLLMVLLNIILRPTLTLLSLVGLQYALNILFNLLDSVWPLASMGQTGGQSVGLTGMIVYVGSNMYFKYQMITNGYAFAFHVVDRGGAYIGASMTSGYNDGQTNSNMMGGQNAFAKQAIGAAVTPGGGGRSKK